MNLTSSDWLVMIVPAVIVTLMASRSRGWAARAVAVLVLASAATAARAQSNQQGFDAQPLPALPRALDEAVVGVHGGTVMVAGADGEVFALPTGAMRWENIGRLDEAAGAPRVAASTADGVVVVHRTHATLLTWSDGRLIQRALPPPPAPIEQGAATSLGRTAYLAAAEPAQFLSLNLADEAPAWKHLPAWPAPSAIVSPALVGLQETVYLFGSVDEKPVAYAYTPRTGWSERAPPPRWQSGAADAAVPYGHAHIFVFAAAEGRDVPTYHTITNTWLSIPLPEPLPAGTTPIAAASGKQSIVLAGATATTIAPKPIETNYGWWDHAVVAIYLVGMVAMGWYFAGREKNTEDYFRGGKRIPWWATGMSLFATGSSAISLMSMPGKAYQANWAYFSISIFSLVALPVSIYFLAPLVRRLNIATSNEYLERRFGVTARLFASSIYCFTQVFGRMAPVLLLPSIALSAITGIDIVVSILIMGLITTIYTFLGGLEAVIWTDTVQGFIMCGAVAGCLLLALMKLSMGPGEIWSAAEAANKLHVFDWSLDATYPVVWVFAVSTIVLTLGYVGDQNFVQRVQCTPTLGDAKKAVATQLAVAVPINILLFALGTALWLFYRGRPEQLNPAMETDGIFPFFVAQQLPPGVSGLVVAALLAATMSTISSSICAVADLGVNDFYRRFAKRPTERASYLLGRVLMAAVGVFGTGIAILLGRLGAASVWDLALLVTGLISNGIIGLFWVGLLTRRAHQTGVLLGVVCGMVTVVLFQQNTAVHFLWYQTIGAAVTVVTGYVFSLILPGRVRDLAGLTIFTLPDRSTPDRDADAAPAPSAAATAPATAPAGTVG